MFVFLLDIQLVNRVSLLSARCMLSETTVPASLRIGIHWCEIRVIINSSKVLLFCCLCPLSLGKLAVLMRLLQVCDPELHNGRADSAAVRKIASILTGKTIGAWVSVENTRDTCTRIVIQYV